MGSLKSGWASLGSQILTERDSQPCIQFSPANTSTAFDSYDDWVQNSVVGVPALNSIPLRVDCGTFDRFCSATRQFVSQLKIPPAGSFSLGGHDIGYWRTQLPGELAWMAT